MNVGDCNHLCSNLYNYRNVFFLSCGSQLPKAADHDWRCEHTFLKRRFCLDGEICTSLFQIFTDGSEVITCALLTSFYLGNLHDSWALYEEATRFSSLESKIQIPRFSPVNEKINKPEPSVCDLAVCC